MAQLDWTELTNSLSTGSVDRGVTAGVAKPNGGGNFVYGFNSLSVVEGAVGLFVNQTNFAPIEGPASRGGGSIRGVIKRAPSGGNTDFAPFLFIGLQGTDVSDSGYLLGLSDAEPSHLSLIKGVVASGIPDLVPDPGTNTVLTRSTATYSNDTYVHVRLDMIVNENEDVVLKVFTNDLATNPLGGAPVWVEVPGMEEFIDDALAINSGTQPYTSGYIGFGYQCSNVSRRCYFDHVEAIRQLP